MKAYPEYKDSGIEWLGEIPEHWEVVKLKRATQFLYGGSLANDDRVDGDVPVHGSNGIMCYQNHAITEKPCIIIGRKGSFGKVNYSDEECFPIDTTFYIDRTSTGNNCCASKEVGHLALVKNETLLPGESIIIRQEE